MVTKPSMTTTYPISWNTGRWGHGKNAPSPEYVVVHFTGGLSDSLSGMLSCYKAYKQKGSTCHYIVGSSQIWQCVDPHKLAANCSCAAIKATADINLFSGALTASHIKIAGNYNTINVECCSLKKDGCSAYNGSYTQHDWYFSSSTYTNAVQLVAWLLDEFSLTLDSVIMHNQVSGKLCPAMWCNSDSAYKGWYAFKAAVGSVLNSPTAAKAAAPSGLIGTDTSSTLLGGTITVAAGATFYNSPSCIVATATQQGSSAVLNYTAADSGFYYVPSKGWTSEVTNAQ